MSDKETSIKQDLKEMPHNLEAEQTLLGSIMHDNTIYEYVSEYIRPEHFYVSAHSKIYKRMSDLIQMGQIANPITLVPLLKGEIENIKEYLVSLSSTVVSSSVAQNYAKILYDIAIKRDLIHVGEKIATNGYNTGNEMSAKEQIELAEKNLFDIAIHGLEEKKDRSFSTIMNTVLQTAQRAYRQGGNIVGITTGLAEIDKCLGGLHPSDLIIIAGRPSMGKTALGVNIAFNAAQAYAQKKHGGAKVAFFSLEMSDEQLGMRIAGQEANIPSDQIRRGAINTAQLSAIAQQINILKSLPMIIIDTPSLSINALNTYVRRLVRQENIGLVVIDYLQLLTVVGKSENRVQELSVITRSLKAIAKTYNIPVIALAQLSRAVEQREDKHPQLSDLRESGDIEQAADVVCMLKRDAYYLGRQKPTDDSVKMDAWQKEMKKVYGKATLMIAKQRHGPIKNITLAFNEALTKFSNYTGPDASDEAE